MYFLSFHSAHAQWRCPHRLCLSKVGWTLVNSPAALLCRLSVLICSLSSAVKHLLCHVVFRQDSVKLVECHAVLHSEGLLGADSGSCGHES